MKYLILVSLISVFTLVACNEKTSDSKAGAVETANAQKIAYPHNKDFFKSHGQGYYENRDQCLSCHEKGDNPTAATAAVSCKTCHEDFPHPRNWVMKENHAAKYKAETQNCRTCHGSDLKGGNSKVSCQSCHEQYPHKVGWGNPAIHGKSYLAVQDKNDCLKCHNGSDKKSNTLQCASCHKAFPHEAEYDMNHAEPAKYYEGKCTSCHRDLKENMPNYAETGGCITCHDGTPKMKWVVPKGHTKIETIKSNREPTSKAKAKPSKTMTK